MARIKSTPLTRALALLDDDSITQTPLAFWRKGKTGQLHASQTCYRTTHPSGRATFTLAEAAQTKTCDVCFPGKLRDSDTIYAALQLETARELIDHVKAEMADLKGAAASIYHDQLTALDERITAGQDIDALRASAKRISKEREQLLSATKARISQGRPDAILDAACALELVIAGRESQRVDYARGIPLRTQEEHIRSTGRAWRPGDWEGAYATWQKGKTQRNPHLIEEARLQLEQMAHLEDLSQLTGIAVPAGTDGDDLLTIARQSWEKAVKDDARTLIQRWEAEYDRNLADTDEVTVGVNIRYHWRIDGSVVAIMRVHGAEGERDKLVARVPRVVAYQLRGMTGADECHIVEKATDDRTLQAAAVLWAPNEADAVYADLEAALSAAEALSA